MMILLILLTAFLFRLALSFQGTLWLDMNAWIGWGNRLSEVGFKNFYETWSDYLPSYLYILWFLAKFRGLLLSLKIAIPPQVIYKLPSILADLLTAFLLYKIVQKTKKQKLAIAGAIIYLANPAIWANSTLWGQVDSFFAFFLLLTFLLFTQKRFFLTGLTLAFTCLLKPLGFLLLPFFSLSLIKEKKVKPFSIFHFPFSIFFLALFLPFVKGNIYTFIIQRFSQTLNQYPYTSLNAFNFWAFLGKMWVNDRTVFGIVNYQLTGLIIFSLFYFWFLISFLAGKTEIYKKALLIALVFFTSFLFLTRMHERHLLPIFPFLSLEAIACPLLWIPYFLSSAIYVANLYHAHALLSNNSALFSPVFISLLSLTQLFVFLSLPFLVKKDTFFSKIWKRFVHQFLRLTTLRPTIRGVKSDTSEEGLRFGSLKKEKVKQAPLLLSLILTFAFLTRFINLGYPKAYVFDEVYHAFTAQEMVKGNKAAWEWWNTPPKGFAYEWTHPPLAKLIMASGIIIGKNLGITNDFFSWRLPAALFGTVSIFLTYLLAKRLFNSQKIALLASFLLSCEGLNLVMSRVGMSDIYFLCFVLLALLFALDKQSLLAGIFWGASLSTKWTGIYLLPLFLLVLYKQYIVKWLPLIVLPPLVYLLSYTLFFTSGHNLGQFVQLQNQMWWYHTNLKATHNYQSTAFTWPFNLRPVWFYVNYEKEAIGNIYALGNPIIFWLGLIILPLFAYEAFLRKSKIMFFTLFSYFIFWLPWVFSPRIMFLYHYLPSLPFLSMILAWELNSLQNIFRKILFCFLVFTLTSFFFFYPLWTGIPLPKNLLKYFFWLPTWR